MIKASTRYFARFGLFTLAILVFSGVVYEFNKFSGAFMSLQPGRIANMYEKTRLACFGRFVIIVPDDVIMEYGTAELDGSLTVYRDRSENLDQTLSAKMTDVQKEISYLGKSGIDELNLLGKIFDGPMHGQKTIIGPDYSNDYSAYSYLKLGKDLLYFEKNALSRNESPLHEINKFFAQLVKRDNEEVPAASGICFNGGFINADPTYENISFGLRFKELPDVRFSIQTRKNQNFLQESSGPKQLRERAKARAGIIELTSFFSRITTIREGMRQLDGWEGEEVLTRRPAYKGDTDAHEFRFFSAGLRNSALHPLIDIRLDSGVQGNAKAKVTPGLSDEEALELWDRLISSLRVRQPSDATLSAQPTPETQLGAVIKTGDTCPQSGWWECLEKRNIQGERRRLFKAGDKLPPVIATGGTSLWRTLIGDVYDVATVQWQLVDYEDAAPVPVDKEERSNGDVKDNYA